MCREGGENRCVPQGICFPPTNKEQVGQPCVYENTAWGWAETTPGGFFLGAANKVAETMAEQRLGVPCSPSVPGRAAQILEEKMEGVGWAESPTGTQTPFCEGR